MELDKERYELLIPEAEICIGECTSSPYSKSQAINNAEKKSTRDIFIIADADVVFDIEYIKLAIDMLSYYKFVIPYSKVIKFNKDTSLSIIANNPNIIMSSIDIAYDSSVVNDYHYVGLIGIIRKKHFKECGGFNERFRGWGAEDDAFICVTNHLYGQYGRPINMTIYHLFHES